LGKVKEEVEMEAWNKKRLKWRDLDTKEVEAEHDQGTGGEGHDRMFEEQGQILDRLELVAFLVC